jgi:hypothetical protein
VRDDYSDLVGHAFPGGEVVVPWWMNRLWADSVQAADPSPHVHPLLVYYASVRGAGVTFADIFALMDAPAESGIVVGEQALTFDRPILVDHSYDAAGGITGVVRKHGRRAGAFDMLTFEITLTETGAREPSAVSGMTLVFPRP